ncbi:MAG: NUDIX domain-containing protein [Zoogloeaceae bacterium]|jgi:8-oxo-dGTP pyrophosphatase MutT (NUDIX family)|nr:NUDIX domain-containing protein [Zoogloeaceae bacterium]
MTRRVSLNETFLEFPAGKLDALETPEQAAIRELPEVFRRSLPCAG